MSKPSDVREISRVDINAYLKAREELQAMKDAYLGLRAELTRMEETIWGLDPHWDPDAPTEELKSIEEKLPALKENKRTKRGYFRTLIGKPTFSISVWPWIVRFCKEICVNGFLFWFLSL